MAFQEKLRNSAEYQQATAQSGGQRQAQQDAGEVPVPDQVDAVVSLEKGDIEFWLRVATVILLWMILQELKRGSR